MYVVETTVPASSSQATRLSREALEFMQRKFQDEKVLTLDIFIAIHQFMTHRRVSRGIAGGCVRCVCVCVCVYFCVVDKKPVYTKPVCAIYGWETTFCLYRLNDPNAFLQHK